MTRLISTLLQLLLHPLSDFSLSTILSTLLLVAITTLIFSTLIYNLYLHPLRHIPGPFFSRASFVPYVYRLLTGYEYLHDAALFARYGPVVRTAPDILMFSDPSWLPLIYHRTADKGQTYAGMSVNFGLVGILGHKNHAAERKVMQGLVSGSALIAMKEVVQKHAVLWIDALKAEAAATCSKDGVVNIAPWSTWLAYDILSEVAFGASFGMVAKRSDVEGLVKSFDEIFLPVEFLWRCHELVKWIQKLPAGKRMFEARETDKSGVGVILRFAHKMLDDRLAKAQVKEVTERRTFLNHLLAADPPMELTPFLRELLLLMVAGTDTTSITLRQLLLNLSERPACLKRCISDENYLSACFQETMRFTPTVHTPLPRLVSAPGIELGGLWIPGGTEIYAHMYCIHRDTATFGKDADQWGPERWLDATPQMRAGVYAWGYGPRVCLGKQLAEQEVLIVARRWLDCFGDRWEVKGVADAGKIYGMRRHTGFQVRLPIGDT